MTIAQERAERHERMKAELAASKPKGGAPKGKRNGKAVRLSSHVEGEQAKSGVHIPLDF